MTDIPHFDVPFKFGARGAVVVEQDSLEDISNCVEAVVRYRKGAREDLPDFGLEDQTFHEGALDLQSIQATVSEWEPRAALALDEEPDLVDNAVRRVLLQVGEANG